MNTPRSAVAALISALAAAPSFSQPLMSIPGPGGSAQCVIGAPGCGASLGSIMDPMGEGALMGLSQSMIPPLGDTAASGSASGGAAAKKAPSAPAKAPEPEDGGTDLVAIGGQIINPLGAASPLRAASAMNLGAAAASAPARQATFDTHIDGANIPAPYAAKAGNLSYVKAQKVEAIIGGKGDAFGTDPKLNAGDAGFSSGASNGPR